MSLRYTGEATMDEPALRDVERWKDKIEVRLDNRQVFFLFFGSAMVACMLFVLGVIVGKRLESRGRAEAPAVEDPLAVLDRFGATMTQPQPQAALAFPRALIGGGPSKNRPSSPERVERADRGDRADKASSTRASDGRLDERVSVKTTLTAGSPLPLAPAPAEQALPVVVARPASLPTPKPSTAPSRPSATASNSAASSALPAPNANGATAPGTKKLAAVPRPMPASAPTGAAKAPAAVAVATKEPSQLPKSATAPVGAPLAKGSTVSASTSDKGKGRFLLQLSSFQDRGEADAFARRFSAQNAYVVASELPGKGTWYRVRVGSYGTLQEASAAKANFERDHNVIAYVAGSGPAK